MLVFIPSSQCLPRSPQATSQPRRYSCQCHHPDLAGLPGNSRLFLLLYQVSSIPQNPPDPILRDSRSPESAHRLAHRRDIREHSLRGLERAFGGCLGEAGNRASKCGAAKRGGHTEGHCYLCCGVSSDLVKRVLCCLDARYDSAVCLRAGRVTMELGACGQLEVAGLRQQDRGLAWLWVSRLNTTS